MFYFFFVRYEGFGKENVGTSHGTTFKRDSLVTNCPTIKLAPQFGRLFVPKS